MTTIKEGDKAPDFDLPTDGGGRFRLSEQRGKPVVVYFYPKDDTSGCTTEAIGFTEQEGGFRRDADAVVGISPDDVSPARQVQGEARTLSILLAADEDKKAANAYGVWGEKSMYGRKYMGVDRSTFLIDRNGVVAKAWRNVKVPGHVDEVLDAARLVAASGG